MEARLPLNKLKRLAKSLGTSKSYLAINESILSGLFSLKLFQHPRSLKLNLQCWLRYSLCQNKYVRFHSSSAALFVSGGFVSLLIQIQDILKTSQ